MENELVVKKYQDLNALGLQIKELQKKFTADALECAKLIKPCTKKEFENMVAAGITNQTVIAFFLMMQHLSLSKNTNDGIWGDFEKSFVGMKQKVNCFFAGVHFEEECVKIEIQLEEKQASKGVIPNCFKTELIFNHVDLLQGNLVIPNEFWITQGNYGIKELHKDATKTIENILHEIVRQRKEFRIYNYVRK